MRPVRPTQHDVARAAGVSQAVVSYVINDVRSVSVADETRARVQAAIAELGYVPDHAARSLRSRRTSTIATIIPDITNPYYPEFIRGIQDTARDRTYDVLAFNTDGEREREWAAIEAARRSRADGLIVTPFFVNINDIVPILASGTPVTVMGEVPGEAPPGLPLDTASISGADAAHAVVSYLIGRGHTRIGMISGQTATPPRESRIRGYRQALREHHVPLEEVLIRAGISPSPGDTRRCANSSR